MDVSAQYQGADLRIQHLSVAFDGASVLQNIELKCHAGEFVAVVGPSGCGKSTLLRVLAGLQQPTSGEVQVGRKDDIGGTRLAALRSFVFQDAALLPWRTALDNIRLPLQLRRVGSSQQLTAARAARELVGLSPSDEGKLPKELSGGMRMRVSLARALVTEPSLMLLDEPLAAIDDILREQLLVELSSIWRARRWTGVMVTHNVDEAVFVSQRVLVMAANPGRITAEILVPLPFPRIEQLRATAAFAAITGQVRAALREPPVLRGSP